MLLKKSDLQLLSSGCREAKLGKGNTILSAGAEASHIIYLRTGIVKEFQHKDKQQEHILQVLKGPTYLGLESLSGDFINHISYTSLTDVTICFIERGIFKALILNNGEFSFNILQTVCRSNLKHYHNLTNQNKKHIHGRLADALIHFSKVIFESNEFVLPLNRSEISFLIGTSRESVSKQLRSYERDGILIINGRNITITDFSKLEKISRFG
jgi:CRP-like cAMP-binding protein